MRINKFFSFLLFGFLIVFSCEKKPSLNELATHTTSGQIQILVSTSSANQKRVELSKANHQLEQTNEPNLLQNLAHFGYIAGKSYLQEVIVIGEPVKKGSLVSTLPIGIIHYKMQNSTKDWLVFATISSEICDLEDLIINHQALKYQLQLKLASGLQEHFSTISWLDETYLELKISEIL